MNYLVNNICDREVYISNGLIYFHMYAKCVNKFDKYLIKVGLRVFGFGRQLQTWSNRRWETILLPERNGAEFRFSTSFEKSFVGFDDGATSSGNKATIRPPRATNKYPEGLLTIIDSVREQSKFGDCWTVTFPRIRVIRHERRIRRTPR